MGTHAYHYRNPRNVAVKQQTTQQSDIEQCIQLLERIRSNGDILGDLAGLCKNALQQARLPKEIREMEPDPKAVLVRELSRGYTYNAVDTLRQEIELKKRAFARRQELLSNSLTATQVAELLGTTRQTPHDRARTNMLLAVEDQSRLRFPLWQFDPDGPNGVVPGLPKVLRSLDISPLGKVSWITSPNGYLEGRTPLEAMKAGDVERVVDQALAVGAH